MPSTRKDLSGMKFGRLLVISEAPETKSKSGAIIHNWNCICTCGNNCIKNSGNLLHGDTKSCGCLHSEMVAKRNRENARHGDSKSRLYKIWSGMKNRCYCKSHHEFQNYGGRGISVCDEWMNYANFKKWAISSGYVDDKNCTLDRENNDLNYCPDNCRWASGTVQSNNRRNNVHITFNGIDHTLAEWSKIVGIKQDTISYRIKHGWSIEKALTTMPRK